MTLITGYNRMLADKRKTRQIMIKVCYLFPAQFVMTTLAFFALLSFVHIIQSVTSITICFQLVFMNTALMTYITVELVMLASQRELGVFIMGEITFVPAHRGMARLAFVSVFTFMHIIRFMTCKTCFFRLVLENVFITFMTGITKHFLMPTF